MYARASKVGTLHHMGIGVKAEDTEYGKVKSLKQLMKENGHTHIDIFVCTTIDCIFQTTYPLFRKLMSRVQSGKFSLLCGRSVTLQSPFSTKSLWKSTSRTTTWRACTLSLEKLKSVATGCLARTGMPTAGTPVSRWLTSTNLLSLSMSPFVNFFVKISLLL